MWFPSGGPQPADGASRASRADFLSKFPSMRIALVDLGLHVCAAAFVGDFTASDVPDIGELVARRCERTAHALGDHHVDAVRMLAEHHGLQELPGLGLQRDL